MATQKVTAKQTHPQNKSFSGHVKSDSHILQDMAAYSQYLSHNPTAAREFLKSAGIITAKGNLRKVFGG